MSAATSRRQSQLSYNNKAGAIMDRSWYYDAMVMEGWGNETEDERGSGLVEKQDHHLHSLAAGDVHTHTPAPSLFTLSQVSTSESVDVASIVKTPLPKHTDFSSLLVRWREVASRLSGRDRSRSASRSRSRRRRKSFGFDLGRSLRSSKCETSTPTEGANQKVGKF
ncbi:hypothetical protein BDZ91DRAFT_733888 [Kalaharituber pfeilii]|nr:hypothetical protein BDZ91DRAFT_733888 [Kalaharituber pfeilii]